MLRTSTRYSALTAHRHVKDLVDTIALRSILSIIFIFKVGQQLFIIFFDVSPLNTTQLYRNWKTDNSIQNYNQCTCFKHTIKIAHILIDHDLALRQTHFIDGVDLNIENFRSFHACLLIFACQTGLSN